MSQNITENNKLVVTDKDDVRVFLPSKDIDIFPCSRRGRSDTTAYDPEARLNTERTNRISTAINGFTDRFIDNFDSKNNTLTFVLAGYRVEARNFNPAVIAFELGAKTDNKIYAHLSLHDKVSLMVKDYFTEILYRQSTEENDANSLDVTITDNDTGSDFFVGISFTTKSDCTDTLIADNRELAAYNLPIFTVIESGKTYSSYNCELIQASLLPKIEHGETEDSVKIKGNFTVEHHILDSDGDVTGTQVSFEVTKDKTTLGPTEVTNSFAIKRVSDGGEQTSFEITKHGVGTVNVPLHITKDTEIEGVTSTSIIRAESLIVGEKVEGEVFPVEGTIKAKNNIIAPVIMATTAIDTPQLGTAVLTSDDPDNPKIVVDPNKTLKVNKIDSDTTNGLTIEQAAKLEKTLTVEGATKINDTITAEKLVVNSKEGEVVTPTLQVNRLTSDSDSIIVDDKNLVVTKSLEVLAAKAINEEDQNTAATAIIDKAVIGDLTVQKDDTNLTESTGKITADNVVAKNNIKAPEIYQAVSGRDEPVPVPYIDIVEQANGQWQLQISRVSTIEKQN